MFTAKDSDIIFGNSSHGHLQMQVKSISPGGVDRAFTRMLFISKFQLKYLIFNVMFNYDVYHLKE